MRSSCFIEFVRHLATPHVLNLSGTKSSIKFFMKSSSKLATNRFVALVEVVPRERTVVFSTTTVNPVPAAYEKDNENLREQHYFNSVMSHAFNSVLMHYRWLQWSLILGLSPSVRVIC